MVFYQEPQGYEKTILSDLQGAWGSLRDSIVEHHNYFHDSSIMFHVEEAMSLESVRNLEHMQKTFLVIQSLAQQAQAPDNVMIEIEDVRELPYETLEKIADGEQL